MKIESYFGPSLIPSKKRVDAGVWREHEWGDGQGPKIVTVWVQLFQTALMISFVR